ncbi:MAG: aldo/keto reductase [Oscillospiraceae bacterium]|nr:aldo/keto reductase [Oscillospiraceae bacterium]
MQYRKDKQGNDLSVLGFGCMRFQRKQGKIDMALAEQQIMQAYQGGVNYYDTAYIYPGSEAAIGEVFEKNGIRDKIYIATKLPHYLIKSVEGMEKLFREQLSRLRTDYVDYYLMHMLTDTATWSRLEDLGIRQWLEEKRQSGEIRQIGFSYHGNAETFCALVDAYDWDFCQIQYNYMDEFTQAGRKGLQHAAQKGLPVVIMEPLRGGRLVNQLPEEAQKLFAEHPNGWTPAQWSFRWLWDQPEVTVVLSGMNTAEMVEDNMQTASTAQAGHFGEGEQALLRQVVKAFNAKVKVGCTGCGYCMPCPEGVDIPGTFNAYNRRYQDGWFAALREYFMCTTLRQNSAAASNCIGCGKCEKHCPQGIEIRKHLADAQKVLEDPIYKIARKCAKWFVKF